MKTQCTHCKAGFNVNEKHLGKTTTCPKCKEKFVISGIPSDFQQKGIYKQGKSTLLQGAEEKKGEIKKEVKESHGVFGAKTWGQKAVWAIAIIIYVIIYQPFISRYDRLFSILLAGVFGSVVGLLTHVFRDKNENQKKEITSVSKQNKIAKTVEQKRQSALPTKVEDVPTTQNEAPEMDQNIVRKWYYALDGKQQGPIPESKFLDLIESGHISTSTFVWTDGLEYWVPAQEAKSLIISNVKPPPVPSMQAPLTSLSDGKNQPSGPQTRPWIRYFARYIDICLFATISGFLLELIYPSALELPEALFGIILLFSNRSGPEA